MRLRATGIGAAIVAVLATGLVMAPSAQAATITRTDADCTTGYVTGAAISGSPGDVVDITASLTSCDELYVGYSLVDDTTAINVGVLSGTVSFTPRSTAWLVTPTTASEFSSVQITLGTTPVSGGGLSIANSGGDTTEWSVTISGSPTPPTPPTPTPTPATPPSAPTDAAATAGDRQATVTWGGPTSPGSFAVTNYQVQSTPSGGGCLVPATTTTCTITGLSNGVDYTFQIRALNGGGWGTWAKTAAVTPQPAPKPATIMISGSRTNDDRVARVTGATTNLVGATVQAMLRFSSNVEFAPGSTRNVSANGAFTWKRRLNPSKSLEIYFTSGNITSNTLVLAKIK